MEESQRIETSIESIREYMLVFISFIRIAISKDRKQKHGKQVLWWRTKPSSLNYSNRNCFCCYCWRDCLKKIPKHTHRVHNDKCKWFLFFAFFWNTVPRNVPSPLTCTSKDLKQKIPYTLHYIFSHYSFVWFSLRHLRTACSDPQHAVIGTK